MATQLYVHGVQEKDSEGNEFVILTTPVGIDGGSVKQFLDEEDRPEINPDVRLYRLEDLGTFAEFDGDL